MGRGSSWVGIWIAALLIVLVVAPLQIMPGMSAGTVWAQVDDQDVADDGDGVAAGDNNDGEGSAAEPPKTYLEWAYSALGWLYSCVFLALSIVLVALIVMNVVEVRRARICPVELVEGFEQQLNERRYQDAYELAKTDESFLGHVLAAGLARLSAGYGPAVEAMQEVGEEESMKLDHRLSLIQLIGTISPMVGLFGTVDGMIRSFRLLAIPGITPKPWELAEGISTALFTTLLGLAIAIPAIAVYNLLKNRMARLILEVGTMSESLMRRFEDQQK